MREFITLIEEAQSLDTITANDILAAIPDSPDDVQNGWLGRAYHFANGAAPPESFMVKFREDVERVKEMLSAWAHNPTPLIRGLRHPPKKNHPLGVHWTDKDITAQDYGNGGYILRARISPTDINWRDTILRRLAWPKENEFSVKSGTHVKCTVERGFSGREVGTFEGVV